MRANQCLTAVEKALVHLYTGNEYRRVILVCHLLLQLLVDKQLRSAIYTQGFPCIWDDKDHAELLDFAGY
jgi:hypothetical protein